MTSSQYAIDWLFILTSGFGIGVVISLPVLPWLKAADIIGLSVKPPQHAAVFCVDEKTARPWTCSTRCCHCRRDDSSAMAFEYYRHGTPSRYAALNTRNGLQFGRIERDVVAPRVFTSANDLASKLMRYIRHHNEHACAINVYHQMDLRSA